MGASEWEYIVPYQANLQAVLDDLRRQVFLSGEFIGPATLGLTPPESLEALAEQEHSGAIPETDARMSFHRRDGVMSLIEGVWGPR
jgi:hypothetical protein